MMLPTAVVLLLVSAHLSVAADPPQPKCDSGWLMRGDYCYKGFNSLATWLDAKSLCEKKGAGLVSIKDEEENQFILSKFGSSEYWLAYTDRDQEGYFRWSDFSARGYTNWNSGEPNNLNDEDCVMTGGGYSSGTWNDEDCYKKFSYVCKKPSLEVTDYPEYWRKQAHETLQQAIKDSTPNTNVAKNVIMFLGDGMSISTVVATRIMKGQMAGKLGEETVLTYEAFPHIGLSKTYNTDFQVPDSAGTATAYLTGVKTKKGVIGVDARALQGDCPSSKGREVSSILTMAKEAGMAVGLITTTTITHASPAGLYAHVTNRRWEYAADEGCDDIAKQFVRSEVPIDVAFGGGWGNFRPKSVVVGDESGEREDSLDLIEEWKERYGAMGKAKYITTKDELEDLDDDDADYVLGLFNVTHLDFVAYGKHNEPTLAEMTEKAIEILSRDGRRFFLFVEGGRIDHGHHMGKPHLALKESIEFEKAITRSMAMTGDDTLTIVTSDHSHTMTIVGYPPRGNPILGIVNHLNDLYYNDGIPYTTLTYGIGAGGMRLAESFAATGHRRDPSKNLEEVLNDPNYEHSAVISALPAPHAGDDVAIFAHGPMSHLFHSVHEQNYIMHVMQYAACIGDYGPKCH